MSQYLNPLAENQSGGGNIGTLGEVTFETSFPKIKTFDNLKRKNTARYATHDVIGRKPILEYIGPGLDNISFSMRFDVMLGVNPITEIKALQKIRDNGEAVELVIGGQPMSENLWVVTDISEDWSKVDNRGNLIIANIEVSLQEYVRNPYEKAGGGNSSSGS